MFSKPMLASVATIPSNYTLSGLGTGTLAPHPSAVTGSGAGPYALTWATGSMAGEALTVTVTGAQDDLGNPINLVGNAASITTGLPVRVLPIALALLIAGLAIFALRRRSVVTAAAVLVLLTAYAAHAQVAVVSNVDFVQQPDGEGNTQVVITYDVDVEDLCVVEVHLSKNAGADGFPHPVTSATGDIGPVTPGTGKQIVWAIAEDYPNELIPDAQIRVTATGVVSPKLTISMTGQGAYDLIPPPPYMPGQAVKVVFHPSGGQLLTGTSPYVPPAAEGDPNAGWIFSHWSWNSGYAPQFANPGVEPVVNLVMDADKTIYATFIEAGSTAHPTAQQEQELMQIARGNYVSWTGLSPSQVDALHTKIEKIYADEKAHYQWWGQVTSAIWYGDFGRTQPDALDTIGEGMTWTGMHMAGMAMKHSVMPNDAETLAAINTALDAIDKCSWVTGTPGRMARFSGPANSAPYQWYYNQAYGSVGVHDAMAPYEGEKWLGAPTRDLHTGLFIGLGAVLHYVQDQDTWDKAQMLTERIIDRLIADQWVITDGFVNTTNNATTQQLQYRVAYKANPTKYASLLAPIQDFPGLTPDVRSLYHSVYWDRWMVWGRSWIITLLELDPVRKQEFRTRIQNAYNASARNHMNPFYAAVATLNDEGNLVPDAYATLQGWLLSHPDGPRRYWRSDLGTDPRYTPYTDPNYVVEPALAHHRFHTDFDGQRSAARTNNGNNTFGYTYSNWEVNMYYWMGRVSGAIPAPSGG